MNFQFPIHVLHHTPKCHLEQQTVSLNSDPRRNARETGDTGYCNKRMLIMLKLLSPALKLLLTEPLMIVGRHARALLQLVFPGPYTKVNFLVVFSRLLSRVDSATLKQVRILETGTEHPAHRLLCVLPSPR